MDMMDGEDTTDMTGIGTDHGEDRELTERDIETGIGMDLGIDTIHIMIFPIYLDIIKFILLNLFKDKKIIIRTPCFIYY